MLETQLRALEEVIEIAFSDPYVRNALSRCRIDRNITPNFREPELHFASAKAMICIEEVEVHSLFKSLRNLWMQKIAVDPSRTSLQISTTRGVEACEHRIGELVRYVSRRQWVYRAEI